MFTSRQASGTVTRFLRRGVLTGSAGDLVSGLSKVSRGGGAVLEVGGGVGVIQVALLENGTAATATNVELSTSWEEAAAELITARRLEDRMARIVGDFVEAAATIPSADLVVLHRVVCCYPDWKAMLEAAASKAKVAVGLTFPLDRWWNRIGIGLGNQFYRIRGRKFRGYVHPPEAMMGLLHDRGLATVYQRQGVSWHTVVAART